MNDNTRAQAPVHGRGPLATVLATMALILGATAMGQPLASVTPPGSLLAVEVRQEGVPGEATRAELASLDWEAGLAVLQQAFESVGGADTVSGFLQAFGAGSSLEDSFEFCPALLPYFDYDEGEPILGHYLMSVGFAPFNPIPAVNLLASGYDTDQVDAIIREFLACASAEDGVEVIESDQDGVAVTTVTIDFDMSVTFAQTGGFLILSTNPDQARHSVRLASGSDEQSLADAALMQADPGFEDGQLTMQWVVDFTVLSDLVTVFGGEFGPEAAPLVERVNALLLTLGSIRGNLAVQDDGLLLETVMYPDSTGGDEALFDLLTGSGLTLGSPPVLPQGTVGVSSMTYDMTAGFNYLQGWLDTVGEMMGEPFDLRSMLLEMFGFDVDAELLGWQGNEVHMLQLDHSIQGLESFYPGAGVALVLPVPSGADAQAGFSGMTDRIMSIASMFAELEGEAGLEMTVRPGEYRGQALERVLIGPINDLSVTVLGDNLVITIPAVAMNRVIDAWLDSEAGPVPFAPTSGNLTAVSHQDIAGELHAFAGFVDLLVQPVAYAARLGLLDEREWIEWRAEGGSFMGDDGWPAQDWSSRLSYGSRDVSAIEYSVVGTGTHEGVITASPDGSRYATYFLLEGIDAGQEFTVSQTSADMDSYLYLIELETGNIVAYNDDFGGTRDSTIIYTADEGVTYLVEATSWSETSTGAFVLEVSVAGQEEAVVEEVAEEQELPPVPSFGELVELGELFPAAVRIIADRSGPAYGHTEIVGDTVRTRAFYTFDW